MESFEANIMRGTDPDVQDLLGAIGLVVNKDGSTLYHRAFGRQSLVPDAPPLDLNSSIFLASAGKILTHIAALQLVEKGILGLDESVYKHLPELADLEVISPSPSTDDTSFTLSRQTRPITLRQLLGHTSGIGTGEGALTEAWRAATPEKEWPEGTSAIVQLFSAPLLFQPGESWEYGHSIHWLQLLIQRASGAAKFVDHMQTHVFEPLAMNHSSYVPSKPERITSRLLQCVRRKEDGGISAAEEGELSGLASTIEDVKAFLVDLLADRPKLLSRESMDLLFEPGLSSGSAALEKLRKDEETFAKTIGLDPSARPEAVNFTCGGALVTQDEIPASRLPTGTLSWNGWPNLIWTINREKGIATLFATQLVPVDDKRTLVHMTGFLKSAWTTFG